MKALHPCHCSLLIPRFIRRLMLKPSEVLLSQGIVCSTLVLSALIMGGAHFSKPTSQQHIPLQHSSPKASAPHSATVTEFCTAAWGKFCPVLIEGGRTLSLLSHSLQFGSYQRISKISSYQCTFSQLFVQ